MPRGDKSGREGQGPMTGRGLGYCAGYPNPGFVNNFFGRGIGGGRTYGRGLGMGFRGGRGFSGYTPQFMSPPLQHLSEKDELNIMEVQGKNLKKELDEIHKRISELKSYKNDQKEKKGN